MYFSRRTFEDVTSSEAGSSNYALADYSVFQLRARHIEPDLDLA